MVEESTETAIEIKFMTEGGTGFRDMSFSRNYSNNAKNGSTSSSTSRSGSRASTKRDRS